MKTLSMQREMMISEHLAARGIRDAAVLNAMRQVPREEFVPWHLAAHAYEDRPLPIEEEQTISQPYMVAYMAEALQLAKKDRVLEIGTGSGYSAAVLSLIAGEIFTMEHFAGLAQKAAERLRRLDFNNINILVGDGTLGWPEFAPYDAIQVTAGAPKVPEALKEQLAIGGRLVIPVGPTLFTQSLLRVHRVTEDEYRSENLCAVQFVPLVGAAGWKM